MTFRAPAPRTLVLALLLAAATLVSGCIYLRLLQLKYQLADFDKHFAVQSDDGLKIVCRDPVLLTDDVRWLGADPEEIKRLGESERWHVRWAKDLPKGITEDVNHDVDVYIFFAQHELEAVQIPEKYFSVFPKDLLIGLLRSTGRAQVDRKNKQAEIDTSSAAAATGTSTPDRESVEKLLGTPTAQTQESTHLRYRYRYRTQTPRGPGKAIDVTFVFDRKTDRLRRLIGKLPKGTLTFEFGAPSAEKSS